MIKVQYRINNKLNWNTICYAETLTYAETICRELSLASGFEHRAISSNGEDIVFWFKDGKYFKGEN